MVKLSKAKIWSILDKVKDPEIPVITIRDLGILQDIHIEDGRVIVDIIPTYSGCPAMDMISSNIRTALKDCAIEDVEVRLSLIPVWTTSMISNEGRIKLREYGIAPPEEGTSRAAWLKGEVSIMCPRCDSSNTEMISQFGSTPCKSLYRCLDCREPFDYFKCL